MVAICEYLKLSKFRTESGLYDLEKGKEFSSEDTDKYEDAWETLRMDWSTRARYAPRLVLPQENN